MSLGTFSMVAVVAAAVPLSIRLRSELMSIRALSQESTLTLTPLALHSLMAYVWFAAFQITLVRRLFFAFHTMTCHSSNFWVLLEKVWTTLDRVIPPSRAEVPVIDRGKHWEINRGVD